MPTTKAHTAHQHAADEPALPCCPSPQGPQSTFDPAGNRRIASTTCEPRIYCPHTLCAMLSPFQRLRTANHSVPAPPPGRRTAQVPNECGPQLLPVTTYHIGFSTLHEVSTVEAGGIGAACRQSEAVSTPRWRALLAASIHDDQRHSSLAATTDAQTVRVEQAARGEHAPTARSRLPLAQQPLPRCGANTQPRDFGASANTMGRRNGAGPCAADVSQLPVFCAPLQSLHTSIAAPVEGLLHSE